MFIMDEETRKRNATALLIYTARAVTVIGIFVNLRKKQREQTKKKRIWCKEWHRRRSEGRGVLNMLNNELLTEDPLMYRNFIGMNEKCFQELLSMVEPLIKRQDTNMRQCVTAKSRLQITLRFLATGDTYRSLMFSSRIHESTISQIVPEVCKAIFQVLRKKYLTTSKHQKTWDKVAQNFYELWQFPQCVGALGGRHIKFRPPRSAGSYYYNYKGEHSVVLLAMSDAYYRFTYVNVGVSDQISDDRVFQESNLPKVIFENVINLPEDHALPGRSVKVPYLVVADDAFPLSRRLLKPFPQTNLSHNKKIFNYRLSRAKRVVENAFGILAYRFKVLLNPIALNHEKVEIITLACTALHNYLATEAWSHYVPDDAVNDDLQLTKIGNQQTSNKANNSDLEIRDEYMAYFCHEGAVGWQDDIV